MKADGASGFDGARVLVVEDEMLIAMALGDLLEQAGIVVVGPVSRVEAALRLVEGEPLDAALLDVRLGVEDAFPVADALAADEIPFVFLTGHAEASMPQRHRERPCLAKPYMPAALLGSLRAVL